MDVCRTRAVGPISIALLFLVFGSSAFAAAADQTAGFVNGRGWKGLSLDTKTTYLWGLSEGSEFIRNNSNILPKKLSFRETAEALDAFFKEPTNANVPVPAALLYIRRKVEGASEAELKDLESKMRKEAQSLVH